MGMYATLTTQPARGSGDAEVIVSLEKAWHGIHFLLAGDAEGGTFPRGFLLEGGTLIGDEDEGRRRLSPAEVKQVSQMLAGISEDDFWANYDAEKLSEAGVYPDIWDEPEEDLREEYCGYFAELKEFFLQAAAKAQSVAIDIG